MTLDLIVLVAYGISLSILSLFSLNRYILISLFRRHRMEPHPTPPLPERLPVVTVQLPVFNELYVAERLIRSACALDYPRDRLQIQVLDDSTDETLALTRRLVARFRARGFDIEHLHRTDRTGYKSGALANGLEHARGELVAVFDADFVIPKNFLRRTVPHFADEHVGVVQARWSYLNEQFSMLTRVTALGLSGQFVIEQPARDWGGLFLTFNGTAGVLRASAIRDAGGWQHDTITEDLDLSYRAQLKGWRIKYLSELTADSELPADIHALKAQQFRWTKGSQETMRKLIGRLWHAELPTWQKIQGSMHLLGNAVYPFLLLVGILNPLVMLVAHHANVRIAWPVSAYFLFSLGGTFAYYAEATRVIHDDWLKRVVYLPIFLGASIGLSIYNAQAAIEGMIGKTSPFIRTPKYKLGERPKALGGFRYHSAFTRSTIAELVMALYTLSAFVYAAVVHEWGALPFLALFGYGYLLVGTYSVRHAIGGARPPRRVLPLPAGQPATPRPKASTPAAVVSRASRFVPIIVIASLLHCGGERAPDPGARAEAAEVNASLASGAPGVDSVALAVRADRGAEVAPGGQAPSGMLWYTPSGHTFDWRLRASNLTPGRAYRLELTVDGAPYDVASARADESGALSAAGRLLSFVDRVCMGATYRPATPLAGTHVIQVGVKDDGAPGRGSDPGSSPTGTGGPPLQCSGNGDGAFGFRLFDVGAIRFSGN
ncbi:MAG TPA: glycosyltransferase [Gemmatimonadaceae bacterium]|nr:glycosyltransferase [Gemmatimonadaceae bacterium]